MAKKLPVTPGLLGAVISAIAMVCLVSCTVEPAKPNAASLTSLRQRVATLGKQLAALEANLQATPTSAPAPGADGLEQRLRDIEEKVAKQLATIGGKLQDTSPSAPAPGADPLEQRLRDLEEKLENLDKRVELWKDADGLRRDFDRLQATVHKLPEADKAFKQRLEELSESVDSLKDAEGLRAEFGRLQAKVHQLPEADKALGNKIEALLQRYQAIETQLSGLDVQRRWRLIATAMRAFESQNYTYASGIFGRVYAERENFSDQEARATAGLATLLLKLDEARDIYERLSAEESSPRDSARDKENLANITLLEIEDDPSARLLKVLELLNDCKDEFTKAEEPVETRRVEAIRDRLIVQLATDPEMEVEVIQEGSQEQVGAAQKALIALKSLVKSDVIEAAKRLHSRTVELATAASPADADERWGILKLLALFYLRYDGFSDGDERTPRLRGETFLYELFTSSPYKYDPDVWQLIVDKSGTLQDSEHWKYLLSLRPEAERRLLMSLRGAQALRQPELVDDALNGIRRLVSDQEEQQPLNDLATVRKKLRKALEIDPECTGTLVVGDNAEGACHKKLSTHGDLHGLHSKHSGTVFPGLKSTLDPDVRRVLAPAGSDYDPPPYLSRYWRYAELLRPRGNGAETEFKALVEAATGSANPQFSKLPQELLNRNVGDNLDILYGLYVTHVLTVPEWQPTDQLRWHLPTGQSIHSNPTSVDAGQSRSWQQFENDSSLNDALGLAARGAGVLAAHNIGRAMVWSARKGWGAFSPYRKLRYLYKFARLTGGGKLDVAVVVSLQGGVDAAKWAGKNSRHFLKTLGRLAKSRGLPVVAKALRSKIARTIFKDTAQLVAQKFEHQLRKQLAYMALRRLVGKRIASNMAGSVATIIPVFGQIWFVVNVAWTAYDLMIIYWNYQEGQEIEAYERRVVNALRAGSVEYAVAILSRRALQLREQEDQDGASQQDFRAAALLQMAGRSAEARDRLKILTSDPDGLGIKSAIVPAKAAEREAGGLKTSLRAQAHLHLVQLAFSESLSSGSDALGEMDAANVTYTVQHLNKAVEDLIEIAKAQAKDAKDGDSLNEGKHLNALSAAWNYYTAVELTKRYGLVAHDDSAESHFDTAVELLLLLVARGCECEKARLIAIKDSWKAICERYEE